MTEEQIKAIKKALAEATQGPWEVTMEDAEEREYCPPVYLPTVIHSSGKQIINYEGVNWELPECIPNAHLIANAPTWLTLLLAEHDTLQQQNKQLIEALEFYADDSTYDIAHLEKHGYIIIDSDGGAKAKLALQQIQGNT